MIRNAMLLALPLALAGCGSAPDQPAAEVGEQGDAAQQRIVQARIVVNADGLSAGGETLGFSTPRAEVDALAEQAFGAAPATSRNEECGAGPMDFSQFGPLQIAYLDGSFAGWFLRAGEGVVTADGIAPGVTTLDALQDERQVQQLDTTLEGEFQYTTGDYGTITGFAAPDGSIDALQAGISCFFR